MCRQCQISFGNAYLVIIEGLFKDGAAAGNHNLITCDQDMPHAHVLRLLKLLDESLGFGTCKL